MKEKAEKIAIIEITVSPFGYQACWKEKRPEYLRFRLPSAKSAWRPVVKYAVRDLLKKLESDGVIV